MTSWPGLPGSPLSRNLEDTLDDFSQLTTLDDPFLLDASKIHDRPTTQGVNTNSLHLDSRFMIDIERSTPSFTFDHHSVMADKKPDLGDAGAKPEGDVWPRQGQGAGDVAMNGAESNGNGGMASEQGNAKPYNGMDYQYTYAPHQANPALGQSNSNDIFAAPSPYSYFHNMSVPSPLAHHHTGPAGFSPLQRTASPLGGIGVNAAGHGLMPSYGSAPSPAFMPTFSDLHNPSRHFASNMTSQVQMSSSQPTHAPNEFGSFNYHPYRSHGHMRSPSSPGPGTPTSHPGSISPPFSAADTSPPTSISAGSRRPATGNAGHMVDSKYSAPTSLVLGGSLPSGGPGIGMVGGHPFVFGGQRSSVSFETPAKRTGAPDGHGSDAEDQDGLSPSRSGPRRTRRQRRQRTNSEEPQEIDAHRTRIESEQRRRDELREGFNKLKNSLPVSGQRASKTSLLDRAVTHISQVEAANRYLHEANERLLRENEKLRDSNHKLVAAQALAVGAIREASDSPII